MIQESPLQTKDLFQVDESTFEEVVPVWQSQLWPERQSPIEKTSAIDVHGNINLELLKNEVFFWKVIHSHDRIIGVVGAQKTNSQWFRSRGLWVDSAFRGQKLASLLMQSVLRKAVEVGAEFVWTMPRQSSVGFYLNQDFKVYSQAQGYEYGPHLLVAKSLEGYA